MSRIWFQITNKKEFIEKLLFILFSTADIIDGCKDKNQFTVVTVLTQLAMTLEIGSCPQVVRKWMLSGVRYSCNSNNEWIWNTNKAWQQKSKFWYFWGRTVFDSSLSFVYYILPDWLSNIILAYLLIHTSIFVLPWIANRFLCDTFAFFLLFQLVASANIPLNRKNNKASGHI